MATEAALYSTFTIERTTADATDVVFGTLTGPLLFADCQAISDTKDSTKYQVICTYIAGTDQLLEYSIFRKTFTHGAAVEVDTALATIAGVQKQTFVKKVSDTSTTTTYDIIVLHLNA
tara:strand:+ start:254 stop:607 length:354 start_codon:yes stop_codon:yes gene_type:complete